jgi:AcrR family transcriptional regulator
MLISSRDMETRPLRADARHNRTRLLDTARDVFVELGSRAPLDEIARRAGTGIGTLYRHFPDRQALQHAVVLDALQRTAEEARAALDQERDPFRALVRYMHRVLDIRIAAVIPALFSDIDLEEPQMRQVRYEGSAVLDDLVAAAHRAGTLRKDVTSADIGLLTVRLSRPLPGPFPRQQNDELAHRHLDLLVEGLRPRPGRPVAISGPAMTMSELQRLTVTDREAASSTARRTRGKSSDERAPQGDMAAEKRRSSPR